MVLGRSLWKNRSPRINYYERECTAEEVALIEAASDAEERVDRADADADRDSYCAMLKREADAARRHPGFNPEPAFSSGTTEAPLS